MMFLFHQDFTVHVKYQGYIGYRDRIKLPSLWEQPTLIIETLSQIPIMCSLNQKRSVSLQICYLI